LADLKARAAAFESFLKAYPESLVRKNVLEHLEDIYQGLSDQAMAAARSAKTQEAATKAVSEANDDTSKELATATDSLKLDPTHLKAIFYSALIEERQGHQANDIKVLDSAADWPAKGSRFQSRTASPPAIGTSFQALQDIRFAIEPCGLANRPAAS
jgi:hypothetical protein